MTCTNERMDLCVSNGHDKVGNTLLILFIVLTNDMGTMMQTTFADSAKVMSKGQVTIPKEVRKVLGVQSGDKVTFVVEGKTVRVMNSASYAMRLLQQDMSEVADRLGVEAEEDVASLISSVRSERQ